MNSYQDRAYAAESQVRVLNKRIAALEEALEALAKAQYDGTVEGLRHQIETEDWGDVLNIAEMTAAYELVLALLSPAPAGPEA